jgi:N-acetylmuramic acid 6-phosphate (MurNAc-6-P) etherase
MVAEITGADENASGIALEQCNMHVKTAVVMLLHGLAAPEARQRLSQAKGSLRRALKVEE